MIRRGVVLAAAALAACGPTAQGPDPAPTAAPAPRETVGAAAPGAASILGGPMALLGAEPFWRLEINPETGLYLTQADSEEALEAPYAAPTLTAEGGRLVSGAFTIDLTIAPCSDGMSESAYPIAAVVALGQGTTLRGCGFRPWAVDIEAFVRPIDRCLDALAEPRPVLFAAEQESHTLVRLSGKEGVRMDCRVRADGDVEIAPTPPDVRDASEGQPVFHRAVNAAAADFCDGPEPARTKGGRVLGWYGLQPSC